MKSWAPWFAERNRKRADAVAERRAVEKSAAAASMALAVARRDAWWRLAEAHGWNGGRPCSSVIPKDKAARFHAFWDAMGAQRHSTEA
jgi:hypothetical protein